MPELSVAFAIVDLFGREVHEVRGNDRLGAWRGEVRRAVAGRRVATEDQFFINCNVQPLKLNNIDMFPTGLHEESACSSFFDSSSMKVMK